MQRTVLVIGLTYIALGGDAWTQEQPRVFRSGVDVVPLYVSVTQNGRPLRDLPVEAFEVRENGRLVELALFARDSPSIAVKVLIDHSKRMERHSERARAAATSLFARLRPEDRAGVGSFSHPGSPFTSDANILNNALATVLAQPRRGNYDDFFPWAVGMSGATTQFDNQDATVRSLWRIPLNAPRRPSVPRTVRAIVVLSSGMEYLAPGWPEHPWLTDKEGIARNILRLGYSVFGVGFNGAGDDKALKALAEQSGGWFLHPKRDTDVPGAVSAVIDDLRHRYVLGFVPTIPDGKDHRIEVRVKVPQALVRTRSLYRAPLPSEKD